MSSEPITNKNLSWTIDYICLFKNCTKEELFKSLGWGKKTIYRWIAQNKTPSRPYRDILQLIRDNPDIINLSDSENWLSKAFHQTKVKEYVKKYELQ